MPNIEIYGLSEEKKWYRLRLVKDAIRAAIAKVGVVNDTIITAVGSTVEKCGNGSPDSFIRIVSTNAEECEKVQRALALELGKTEGGGIDIEVLVIHHFFQV
jgi:hypothetical protein